MIPSSIVRWHCDLAKTLACQSSPTAHWHMWLLGYPEAALMDVQNALDNAREIGHAATLMYALLYVFIFALLAARTTRVRTRSQMSLSRWRIKRVPNIGRGSEPRCKVPFLRSGQTI